MEKWQRSLESLVTDSCFINKKAEFAYLAVPVRKLCFSLSLWGRAGVGVNDIKRLSSFEKFGKNNNKLWKMKCEY